MIYFKSKSIIVLCLFVFITIHDSYGVQTDSLATDKETCERELRNKEYVESKTGHYKSGLDLYLEIFDEFTRSKPLDVYDQQINEKVYMCNSFITNNNFDFEQAINCDIIVHVYTLVEIDNAEVWCKGKGQHHDFVAGTVYNEEGCKKELRLAGFIFEHGLDNYAYLIQKEKTQKKIEYAKNSFRSDYSVFIKVEVSKKKFRLEDAASWCIANECDMALRGAGYKNRYVGGNNRKEMKSNDCEKLKGLPQLYCTFLWNSGSNVREDIGLLGTHGWCLKQLFSVKFKK